MMSLVRRSFRRRSMNMGTMKMAVWCPRLNMYILLRLQWLTALSPTPTTTNQNRGEATVEGEVASRQDLPGEYKRITQLRGSSAT
jgi:hypothetical protein